MSAAGRFEGVLDEIAYAYSNVRFFRAHMEVNGLVPEDVRTPDDFRRIPITRKSDYRRNYPAGVIASGFSLNNPHVMRFQSSGTSGERSNSATLAYDLARRQATSISVNRRFDSIWRPGKRPHICRYAPPNCSDVECATGLSSIDDRLLPDRTLVLPVAHDLLATPACLTDQALDEIGIHDPEMLVADPTHLAFLIRRARARGRVIKTSQKLHIVCGYTQFTRVARRQIEAFFGNAVPIGNMLGMSEFGYLGFECHHGRLHINNCDFYLEFMTSNGPAHVGECAELVITTIGDTFLPRIRYATGDLYRLSDLGCPCGSALPVVTMEGRAANVIHTQAGLAITPAAVDTAIGDCAAIDLYRLEQDWSGAFRFRFVVNTCTTWSPEEGLRANLSALLGDDANLALERTEYIGCERSGKFHSCVPFHQKEH